MKSGKKKKKEEDHNTLWSLYQRSQNLANKTCMRKLSMLVFLISFLLVLVFNLDSFTHMHVQEMFATEEFGCLRVPPSDLTINNNGGK